MRKVAHVLFALFAGFLVLTPTHADAPFALHHVVIIGEGAKGAEISIPRDTTVAIRVEGRDVANKPVPLDPSLIAWRASSGFGTVRSFSSRLEGGKVHVTAIRDAFDSEDGKEPSTMLFANYQDMTAGVVLFAVLNAEGQWRLYVNRDVINLNLRQSGRWIEDKKGRKGTIKDKNLVIKVTEIISVLGIPVTKTLYPKINFTSREAGTGTVEVPFKTEKLTVKKVSTTTP